MPEYLMVRAQLDTADFASAWADGELLSAEQSIGVAFAEIRTAMNTA